jgi:hypothetical protein
VQLWQPGEHVVPASRPGRADEGDPLREQASADETEDLGGRAVEPLGVVDDHEEGPALGHLREERQRGQADEETVRRPAGRQPEHGPERVALRLGERVDGVHHRCAELVQAAERQLHLGLDTDRARDVPCVGSGGDLGEQRGLADACLAPQHEHAAPPVECVGQESAELQRLVPAPDQAAVTPTVPEAPPVRPVVDHLRPPGRTWRGEATAAGHACQLDPSIAAGAATRSRVGRSDEPVDGPGDPRMRSPGRRATVSPVATEGARTRHGRHRCPRRRRGPDGAASPSHMKVEVVTKPVSTVDRAKRFSDGSTDGPTPTPGHL